MNRQYAMGRLYSPDIRDKEYPISPLLTQRRTAQVRRFWYSNGWWGNQGVSPHCVAYSWAHFLHDGPLLGSIYSETELIDTDTLYCEAQKLDPWPGDCDTPLYDGTSVRAGAKVLQDWGFIEEYRWAEDADQLAQAILVQGPAVLGTLWKTDMYNPDREGFIYATGRNSGGHAYIINGVDVEKGFFRLKNSWGKSWGRGGHALIPMEDVDALIKDFGEACIPLQKRFEG